MSNRPKLSVLITTCNLEHYICRALDGVFAQEHEYSFEIVIADDASTDKTLERIQPYQQRFPGLIKLILHKTKVGLSRNYLSAMEACEGDYIALLDGDDYWTDPKKLQTQIAFLEEHSDFVLSCHRFRKYFVQENRYDGKLYPVLPANCQDGFLVDPDVFGNWVTQTLTVVFRNRVVDLNELKSYPSFKDTHLFFCLMQRGKGYVHSFDGGVYTIRGDGHWGVQDDLKRWRTDMATIEELQQTYKDDESLKRARQVFRFGIWEREYKSFNLPPAGNLGRRLWLKIKMRLFNPYKKTAASISAS
jgi:glycosyltransferase involved in cell wall biosynthesis